MVYPLFREFRVGFADRLKHCVSIREPCAESRHIHAELQPARHIAPALRDDCVVFPQGATFGSDFHGSLPKRDKHHVADAIGAKLEHFPQL